MRSTWCLLLRTGIIVLLKKGMSESYRRLMVLLYSIHNLGMVGHIEDIAVAKDQQGKKLGLRIIQALDHVAAQVGCYKVCTDFYVVYVLSPDLTLRTRLSSTALKPMKDSTSSADIEEQVWRWRITMRHQRTVMFKRWDGLE
jgi:hypothetical protein